MREAQCVYVTVSENEGEIYFDGQTPAELKTYIKKMKWLKWELAEVHFTGGIRSL